MESDDAVHDVTDRLRRVRSSIDRYDLVLAIVPIALGGAALTGAVFGVPFEAALLSGVLVAWLAVIDGVFRRPPAGAGRGVGGRVPPNPDDEGPSRPPGREPGVRHV